VAKKKITANIVKKVITAYKGLAIVNVNINIIIASIFSTGITAIPIHLSRFVTNNIMAITILTLIIDAMIDGFIFITFHTLSNRKRNKILCKNIKEGALLQTHRIILSPFFYIIAFVIQTTTLMTGMDRVPSLFIAYGTALLITRMIHTIYCIKIGMFPLRKNFLN
jgi:glucose-6-phosphate-specific signal transduction histidine kinase